MGNEISSEKIKCSVNVLLIAGLCVGISAAALAPDGQEDLCSDPNVFFCENFEARALGGTDFGRPIYKNRGWSLSSGARQTVINSEHVDGGKGIRMVTPANVASGGYMDTGFSGQRTVFWRWYSKWSPNYVWSPVATKHNEMVLSGQLPDGIFNFVNNQGYRNPVITWGGSTGNPWFVANMNSLNQLNVNQWYCFEARVTVNTCATCNDGYIQGWIDGLQRMEYPNSNIDSNGSNQVINGFFLASYWNCAGNEDCTASAYQHPEMYRYMDNLAGR
jgi:hypothetical protein